VTLPLRLTPFERYMLSDDRPLHPMTHISRLVLSGSFVPECFEEAIAKAVQRHPLLRARVRGRTPWSVQWVPAPDPRPYVSFPAAR
jgi:hypothetical protein